MPNMKREGNKSDDRPALHLMWCRFFYGNKCHTLKGKYKEWLTEEGLLQLEAWARDGLTDEQIAANMGVNVATLYRYKQSYCEICNALKRGKEVVDMP